MVREEEEGMTSSLDLVAIVEELEPVLNSKVQKVYQIGREVQMELYGKGKHYTLDIIPGERINLTTKKKEKPKIPPNFCMLLRKHLTNSRLTKVEQHGFDRVVTLTFQKEKTFNLVAELFSKGNLIFCDADLRIIHPLKVEFWKTRAIKPKADYKFPPSAIDLTKATEKEFTAEFKKSEKSAVATLAGLGLGGDYAEEVCLLAKVDKKKPASALTGAEVKTVHTTITKLLKKAKKPKPYLAGEKVFPFKLESQKGKALKSTFNEALDDIVIEPEEKAEKKPAKAEKRRKKVEEAIARFERESEDAKRTAEFIQEHAAEIGQLLDSVRKEKEEGKSWAEIEREYNIKKKANGKIVADL